MRVKIIGENNCAKATRGLLRQAGFAVTEFLPADAVTQGPLAGYVIGIVEDGRADKIHIDSVDCALEAAILKHITQLSKHPVVLNRPGGVVHSDREIGLIVPHDEEEQQAVEFGVLRGLLEVTGQVKAAEKTVPPRQAAWYQRIFS
ncbi:MAG TPA: hypothetical protein VE077_06560 [Candidatus Methylomirabilis sp.]|nr:hypothetical protein [Candidatus Methylomirabilis sp.]